MEEKGTVFHDGLIDSSTIKSENVPIQVTTLKLTKENYILWIAAIKMGIAEKDQIDYINGRQKQPGEDDPAWRKWHLEENQVNTWIINSVSSDIQLLILRKETDKDM